MKKITKKQREYTMDLVNYWIKQLKIQDWTIHTDILNPDSMADVSGSEGTLGLCQPMLARRIALLHLLRPDAPQYDNKFEDFEHTIIHELLHILFAIAPESMVILEEQAVDGLATTLKTLNDKANARTRRNTKNDKVHKTGSKALKKTNRDRIQGPGLTLTP